MNFLSLSFGTGKVTALILALVTLGLIIYDVYVAMNKTPGDTISEVLLKMAYQYPILPFAIGLLIGHLFWPQR